MHVLTVLMCMAGMCDCTEVSRHADDAVVGRHALTVIPVCIVAGRHVDCLEISEDLVKALTMVWRMC